MKKISGPSSHQSVSTSNSRQQELEKLMTELAQAQAVLQLRREKPPPLITVNNRFRKMQRAYYKDPLAFIWDMFDFSTGDGPTPYQAAVITGLVEYGRVALYGPRGLGKTAVGAWLTWWGVLTAEDVKVPTTASAWRQLQKYLWPEIHKWHYKLQWNKLGIPPLSRNRQLKTTEIELSKMSTAFAVASNDYNKIEGAHAKNRVFCIFDESKAIVDSTFNSIEGAFAQTEQPLALAMSTPGPKLGRFYDICTKKDGYEDWHVIHVSMEDAITAKRMDPKWAAQRKKQWGEDSAIYRNHVQGEFASDAEQTVIPIHFVELAEARWDYIMKEGKVGAITSIGVDPARGGGDKTVVALASGFTVVNIMTWDYSDTMLIADEVSKLMVANPLAKVVVDVIGLGAGVYDRLAQRFGERAVPFNAAEKTEARDRSGQIKFKNKRAYAWWRMREILDPGYNSQVALPEDDELKGELTTPQYEYLGDAMLVQSKEEIRSLISRSTDKADAVINALIAGEVCDTGTTEVLSYMEYMDMINKGEVELEEVYA